MITFPPLFFAATDLMGQSLRLLPPWGVGWEIMLKHMTVQRKRYVRTHIRIQKHRKKILLKTFSNACLKERSTARIFF